MRCSRMVVVVDEIYDPGTLMGKFFNGSSDVTIAFGMNMEYEAHFDASLELRHKMEHGV